MKSSSFRLSALWLRTKVSPAGVNWTDTSDCSASAARSNSDRLGWSSFGDLRCGRAPQYGESVSRVGRSVEYGGMPVRGDTWCVSVGSSFSHLVSHLRSDDQPWATASVSGGTKSALRET